MLRYSKEYTEVFQIICWNIPKNMLRYSKEHSEVFQIICWCIPENVLRCCEEIFRLGRKQFLRLASRTALLVPSITKSNTSLWNISSDKISCEYFETGMFINYLKNYLYIDNNGSIVSKIWEIKTKYFLHCIVLGLFWFCLNFGFSRIFQTYIWGNIIFVYK